MVHIFTLIPESVCSIGRVTCGSIKFRVMFDDENDAFDIYPCTNKKEIEMGKVNYMIQNPLPLPKKQTEKHKTFFSERKGKKGKKRTHTHYSIIHYNLDHTLYISLFSALNRWPSKPRQCGTKLRCSRR